MTRDLGMGRFVTGWATPNGEAAFSDEACGDRDQTKSIINSQNGFRFPSLRHQNVGMLREAADDRYERVEARGKVFLPLRAGSAIEVVHRYPTRGLDFNFQINSSPMPLELNASV